MKILKKSTKRKSLFSIKTKIVTLCTCSILIAVLVTFFNMASSSKNIVTKSNELLLETLATSYHNNLTESIRQLSQSANFMMSSSVISEFVQSGDSSYQDQVAELCSMFLSSNTTYDNISIVNENGDVLYSTDSTKTGSNLANEDYFTTMVSSGLSTQGGVFTSQTSGEPSVTFAIPLRSDLMMNNTMVNDQLSPDPSLEQQPSQPADMQMGLEIHNTSEETAVEEFTGAIITSVKVSAFDNILADLSIADYESGYAYILDADGNVIYHPDDSVIGSKFNIEELDNLLTEIHSQTGSSNLITYNENGVIKYASYITNPDNNWTILVGADESEVLDSLNVVAANTLLLTVILILLISLVAYLVTGTITKSIDSITELIHLTAELDFLEEPSNQKLFKSRDETGEMSRAISKMRVALKAMILHISEVSKQINHSSSNLNEISIAMNDHATDNSAIAEELSSSMEETAATTEQINAAIEQISNNSRDIANKVILGAKLSEDIINRAADLKVTTTKATQNTQKIYEEVRVKTDLAMKQAKAVEKISLLTKTIKEIASQTNLLALNASIEAARAGEAGSGFTVVAHEIGVLANQSTKTVTNITETVEEVYEAVGEMAKCLEQTLDFLGKNVLSDYDSFLNTSAKYNEDAGVMSETMDNIQTQIEQLNTNVFDIAKSISEINIMISESSSGVNDVAEKNTEIGMLTSQTQEMALQNGEYAKGLQDIVDKFKL
ncbi:MAG: methyl-accepting chemotaxis protein [Mobilitalea sp.]